MLWPGGRPYVALRHHHVVRDLAGRWRGGDGTGGIDPEGIVLLLVGPAEIATLHVRDQGLIQPLVAHAAVEVDERRARALHHERDGLDDQDQDLRRESGHDETDDGGRILGTRGSDDREEERAEQCERHAHDLRRHPHHHVDEHGHAQRDPETATRETPRTHDGFAQAGVLEHEDRRDQQQLRDEPETEGDAAQAEEEQHEHDHADQLATATCARDQADQDHRDDREEAEHRHEGQGRETDQAPERGGHPTPQHPQRGLHADRGVADLGGDDALHHRGESDRGETDGEGGDEVDRERPCEHRVVVGGGGREGHHPGEGREQHEAHQERRDDHHEELDADGEAEQHLRIVAEGRESLAQQHPEGQRVKRDDPLLRRGRPRLATHWHSPPRAFPIVSYPAPGAQTWGRRDSVP